MAPSVMVLLWSFSLLLAGNHVLPAVSEEGWEAAPYGRCLFLHEGVQASQYGQGFPKHQGALFPGRLKDNDVGMVKGTSALQCTDAQLRIAAATWSCASVMSPPATHCGFT
ncbi:hypothetical protein SKAU_G00293780 [Synaphobranchus kaupii]|uniref:Uncharacterized protein n=1 Tax=Synaphobranchus kaupii TaxID=118154 RepID=A0A9Q1EUC2_SYNKA|nr:hypothetical protein SKAU_G00293780 [Synaphobranchus kaupii]